MTRTDVLGKLQKVFDDTFLEPVAVTPELTADDVEEWDSLIHISLILAVEKAFGIRFRVGEVEATRNVGDLADLIIQRRIPSTAS
jgi:acyl carrier protein